MTSTLLASMLIALMLLTSPASAVTGSDLHIETPVWPQILLRLEAENFVSVWGVLYADNFCVVNRGPDPTAGLSIEAEMLNMDTGQRKTLSFETDIHSSGYSLSEHPVLQPGERACYVGGAKLAEISIEDQVPSNLCNYDLQYDIVVDADNAVSPAKANALWRSNPGWTGFCPTPSGVNPRYLRPDLTDAESNPG